VRADATHDVHDRHVLERELATQTAWAELFYELAQRAADQRDQARRERDHAQRELAACRITRILERRGYINCDQRPA
jgi:hypothetical protein